MGVKKIYLILISILLIVSCNEELIFPEYYKVPCNVIIDNQEPATRTLFDRKIGDYHYISWSLHDQVDLIDISTMNSLNHYEIGEDEQGNFGLYGKIPMPAITSNSCIFGVYPSSKIKSYNDKNLTIVLDAEQNGTIYEGCYCNFDAKYFITDYNNLILTSGLNSPGNNYTLVFWPCVRAIDAIIIGPDFGNVEVINVKFDLEVPVAGDYSSVLSPKDLNINQTEAKIITNYTTYINVNTNNVSIGNSDKIVVRGYTYRKIYGQQFKIYVTYKNTTTGQVKTIYKIINDVEWSSSSNSLMSINLGKLI